MNPFEGSGLKELREVVGQLGESMKAIAGTVRDLAAATREAMHDHGEALKLLGTEVAALKKQVAKHEELLGKFRFDP